MSSNGIYKGLSLEELDEMWKVDCKIDSGNIAGEAAAIPKLHHKYYMLYMQEGLRLKKLKTDLKVLRVDKLDWMMGAMAEEDLKDRGWKPFQRKILRADVDKYLDADKDIINLSLRIDYVESIHKFLEDIVKSIAWRNQNLKTIVDWTRFTAGLG